jgi:hypothetical protein
MPPKPRSGTASGRKTAGNGTQGTRSSSTSDGTTTGKRKRTSSTSSTSAGKEENSSATGTTASSPDSHVTSASTKTATTATVVTQTENQSPVAKKPRASTASTKADDETAQAGARQVGFVVDTLMSGVTRLFDDVLPRAIDDLDELLQSDLFSHRILSQSIAQDQITQVRISFLCLLFC